MIKIVNIKSGAKYDVYCGRANEYYVLKESIFHNPFVITTGGLTRGQAIEKYKVYFLNRIETDLKFKEEVLKLKDMTLACWCVPLDCHCRIIKEFLDNYDNDKNLP